jgi:preprotein translocase subunit YajC
MESAGGLVVLALFMVVMYLLMIRPQQKRQREHQQMISELGVGSDVVTIGGLHGRIEAVGDDHFDLLVNPDVVLRFQKSAIARVVTEEEAASQDEDEDEAVA